MASAERFKHRKGPSEVSHIVGCKGSWLLTTKHSLVPDRESSLSARPGLGSSEGKGWFTAGFASSTTKGGRKLSSRAQQCHVNASTRSSATEKLCKATGMRAGNPTVP